MAADDAKAFADTFKSFDDDKAELDRRAAQAKGKPASPKEVVAMCARLKLPASLSEQLIEEGVTMEAAQVRMQAAWAAAGDNREDHGDRMAATMPRRKIIEFVGRKAETPNAANFLLRMIRTLMQHAVDLGLRDDDPSQHVRRFEVGGAGFHTRDEGEVARLETVHPLGSTARLAFALMLYTGAARVDACRLGWQHVKGGRLRYRRAKSLKTTAMLIDIPPHPDLAAVLDTLPRDRMTFLQTPQGKARSPNGLGNSMRRWCDAASLPDCTSHGLRKAAGRPRPDAAHTRFRP